MPGAGVREAGAGLPAPVPEVRRPGRPLDETRDAPILRACLELLAESGYDRLTTDAVAARARVGKATIYRRWPSKAELVVDALAATEAEFAFPDTGSLAGDLRGAVHAHMCGMDEFHLRVMTGVMTALQHHPDLAAAVREQIVGPRQRALRVLFERGVARGEVAPDRDLDLLCSLVPALIFHRAFMDGRSPDPQFLSRVMEQVVLPLAAAPPAAAPLAPEPPVPVPPVRRRTVRAAFPRRRTARPPKGT